MPYCRNCGNELSADARFCPRCGAPVAPEQAVPQPEPATAYASTAPIPPALPLATWGERFVAWLIDIIILSVIIGLLSLFAWFAVGTFTWWSGWPAWVPFFNFNVGGVIYFLYWLLMDGTYGQSLGKMVLRLRVARSDGSRITMGQAALESLGKAFLLPIDVLLGWILYPRLRQRLFNRVSETVVVRERRP